MSSPQPPPQAYAPATYGYGYPPAAAPQPKNGLGIAALVLGLVGLLFGLIPLTGFVAIILGTIGLVLGLVGLGRIRKHIATNRVLTWFGVATSLGAIVLGVIGLVILASAVDDAVDEIDSALADEAANNRPTEIVEGAGFTHDIWKVQDGWRLTGGQFGSSIEHLKAELVGESADSPLLTFDVKRGREVIASIDCTGPRVQPGEIARLSCLPNGTIRGGYDSITIRDMF
jgi:hypothetical protein